MGASTSVTLDLSASAPRSREMNDSYEGVYAVAVDIEAALKNRNEKQ